MVINRNSEFWMMIVGMSFIRFALCSRIDDHIFDFSTRYLHHTQSYLLYVDGETALSGGCLFTFGLTLLTCLMAFACPTVWLGCWFCCCCCCWDCCCCCCAFSCCTEPVIPPFERRFRLITVWFGRGRNGNWF